MRARWLWFKTYWAVLVLVTVGTGLIVAGLVADRDSAARIAIGAGILVVGVFGDRLQRAKVGPTGAEIELERRAAESTTEFSQAPAAVASPSFPASDQVVDVHRAALASDVLEFLTRPGDGPLAGSAFQLYLYDADQDMLLPALDPAHGEPSPGFRVGEGVAGRAWETGEFTIAEGGAASDATFALSADKQARYADLTAVAAVPVANAAGTVIAVLSASTTDPRSRLATDEGFEALVALGDAVARVLVDLLKWFGDGYDE